MNVPLCCCRCLRPHPRPRPRPRRKSRPRPRPRPGRRRRCRRCNNRKGSHTPEEAGMRLLKRPQPFSLSVSRQIMRYIGRTDESWRKYLFY